MTLTGNLAKLSPGNQLIKSIIGIKLVTRNWFKINLSENSFAENKKEEKG